MAVRVSAALAVRAILTLRNHSGQSEVPTLLVNHVTVTLRLAVAISRSPYEPFQKGFMFAQIVACMLLV